jgi:hypothetical protein
VTRVEDEISHQNNDIIMKVIAEKFKDKSLAFFGLNTPRIISMIPTALPILEAKETRTDFVFLIRR